MPVGLSAAVANELLNAIGNNAAITLLPVASLYVQLHVGDPGAAGTANVAGNSTRKVSSWGAAAGGLLTLDTDITWTTSEVDTAEDYTHFSVWTAATGGTFIGSGTITANPVSVGNEFVVAAGDLTLGFGVAS